MSATEQAILDLIEQGHLPVALRNIAQSCERRRQKAIAQNDYKAAAFWGDYANLLEVTESMAAQIDEKFEAT